MFFSEMASRAASLWWIKTLPFTKWSPSSIKVLRFLPMLSFCFSATDILLAGSSAGGIGAFEHADYVAKLFPQALVKANPIGKVDC